MVTIVHNTLHYTDKQVHCYAITPLHNHMVTPLHGYTVTRLHCYTGLHCYTRLHSYTVTWLLLHGYTVTSLHAPLHEQLHCYTVTLLHGYRLHSYTVTWLHRYIVTRTATLLHVTRLQNVPQQNWSEVIVSYDNMCHLDSMRVEQNPLPLPEPYDKLWLSVTKVQHVSLIDSMRVRIRCLYTRAL